MSLHRNDFLVAGHRAELQRHAADARLAKAALAASSSRERRPPGVRTRALAGLTRALAGLVAALHPMRHAAGDPVTPPSQSRPAAATTGT